MRRKIKKLLRNYKVPVTGTLVFLLCLCGMFLIRHQERVAVVDLAKGNPLINNGKSRLISKDQALALTQNNQTAIAESTKQTNTTSSSSAGQTTQASQGSTPSGAATSTPPVSGGGSPLPPTPPPNEPFSVDIIRLDYNRLMSPPTSGGNTASCTVMHQFTGTIRGNNGPGVFTYHWEQMNGQRSPDFNENAGPGESYLQVMHSWPISSPYGVNYDVWVKLVITSPTFEQRQINFKHYC